MSLEFDQRLSKIVALIYADKRIQESIKRDRKKIRDHENRFFPSYVFKRRKLKPVKEPVFKKSYLLALENEHKRKLRAIKFSPWKEIRVRIKKKRTAKKCICENISDHYLRCDLYFLPFNQHEMRIV